MGTRRVFVRVAAVVGLVFFGFLVGLVAMNVLGLAPSGSQGSPDDPPPSAAARIGAAMPGEWVHAAGAIGLLAIGVASILQLIVRPQGSAAAFQVLAISAAWIVTVPIVGDPNNVGGQAGPVDPIFLTVVVPSLIAALVAAPWRTREAEATGDRRFLALAAVAAVPTAWYAVDQAMMQRNTFPPTADPHHNAHWWVMGIVALAVVFVGVSAAWSSAARTSVALAGFTALAIGLASIASPSSASAVRSPWGVAAIAWGLVALVMCISRRSARVGRMAALRR